MTDRVNVAVIVASRDRPEMVERCLASLRAALRPGDELVLVDSASADPLAYSNVAASHSAHLVRLDVPGVNRARNAGWRSTSADLVLFTDDDVEVALDWADAFVEAFAHDPRAGFLTGRLDSPEGQDGTVATTEGTEEKVLTSGTRGVLGHGASMAVRREVLDQIGGWDDALGAGGRFRSAPELDVFDRVFAAGWHGRYVPASLAEHHQWRTDNEVAKLHFRYAMGAGARMAKLQRTDRQRLRMAVREYWWDWGVHDVWLNLKARYKRGTVVALLRLVGFGAGYLEARTTPVVGGHFQPRR